jgi:hypothetical protein
MNGKHITHLLIATAVVAGAFLFTHTSFAQETATPPTPQPAATPTPTPTATPQPAPAQPANDLGSPQQPSDQQQLPAVPDESSGACSANPSTWGNCIVSAVGWAVLGFSTLILGLAGALFNFVVVKTVFQFSTIVGNSPGLLLAWGVLRDLGNMLLLFGFIFMGLATILNLQSFPTKKAIPKLLVFAVLMNFSLFAAEAVIDTSNAFATVVYNQSAGEACNRIQDSDVNAGGETGFIGQVALSEDCFINTGIGGNIMSATGLTTMFAFNEGVGNLQNISVYLGLSLFAIIGAVVMLAAAIMLVIRAVVLIIIMVTSPIGFAGMAIPMLNGAAKQWWDALLSQSFFAPIMILMILISLKVSESFSGTGGNKNLAAALLNPSTGVMGVLFVFVIVISLLIASLIVARQFGAKGASFAITKSSNFVRGTVSGTSGFVGRRTVGASSSWAQKRYDAYMASGDEKKGFRSVLRTTRFDDALTATLGAGQKAKFGSSTSYKEAKDKKEAKEKAREKAFKDRTKGYKTKDAVAKASTDAEMVQAVNRLSENELAQLDELKKGTGNLDLLAKNLSPEMFEKILNNKDIDGGVKKNLTEARFKGLKQSVQAGNAQEVQQWSAKDLEILAKQDAGLFKELVEGKTANGDTLLSNDQYDALQKSNPVTREQKKQLKDQNKSARIESLLGASKVTEAKDLLNNIGGNKNIAKLSAAVLTHPEVAKDLTVPQLMAIMTEDKLTDRQRADLAREVQKRNNASNPTIQKYLRDDIAAAAYYTP